MTSTITVPELGENVDAVDVVSVLVAVGDTVDHDQPLVEVETEKASVEIPSTAAGVVAEVHVHAGDSLTTGAPIVTLQAAEDSPAPAAGPPAPADEPGPALSAAPEPTPPAEDAELAPRWLAPREPGRSVPAAPSVRRLAREVGVDIARVTASGPGERITGDDVKAHARRLLKGHPPHREQHTHPELPDFTRWGEVTEEPMSKIRRLTAEAMARAWTHVPQVTHNDIADVSELEALRKRYRDRVEAAGGRLTLTALLVKIVASALRIFPGLNSSVDMTRSTVIRKQYINIGVAVDTDHGLLVPVVRDADRKNITRIAVELDDLAARARERKLMPAEMEGGTFSISNLGGIGGTGFSPIVNWPEAAILGVSRGETRPLWRDGEFQPRLILPLSLSYDHRIIDGAEAARFVRWLAEAIEQPLLIALEG